MQVKKHKTSHIFKIILFISAVVFLIIIIIYLVLNLRLNKQNQSSVSTIQTSPVAQTGENIPENRDYEVLVKENPNDKTRSDIYLVDKETQKEYLFLTLNDLTTSRYPKYSHYPTEVYLDNHIYLIRNINDYDVNNYTTTYETVKELWRYDLNRQGNKLYRMDFTDYLVHNDNKYTAINTWAGLAILDNSGKEKTFLTSKDLYPENPLAIHLLCWNDDNIWTEIGLEYAEGIVKVNANDFNISKYDVSKLNFSGDYEFNCTNKKLAYSEYPPAIDAGATEEFINNKTPVNLYVYDLNTQENKLIATSEAKKFHPKWLVENTLEYDNPNGDDRITAKINN